MELSQNPQISSDTRTKGFDLSAGKTWIYPENYAVRDYQFNIVQACLYSNTLVCLPTGLGKTFIAAVVMYNFWRWYPYGKVVFLAPTKPLVAQQIFACHNTMGIPSAETIELTGTVSHKQREIAWLKKRVIFATPQVFHNDLDKNIVPSDLIRCVIIDEAHKALGKHSYRECIRILSEKNQTFRVLALSATPGNKIDNVHEVLQNLLIARVELRDESSLDIIPYVNKRKVDIILVPLNNELAEYKERYIFIMDRHVKILLRYNVLRGHTANISKGRMFHLLKEYQKKTNKSGNYGQIIKTLNILMTMYHAYELMVRDGLRAFHKFYQNHSDKFWMNEEPQLQTLLEDIGTYLGPFPDTKMLYEAALTDIPQNLVFGHTKFDKLKELLLRHFKNSEEKQNGTRAIVFVEYRDIVSEIYVLLLQCQPLIRPQMFVGQAGQKQKQQIKALENFRNNHVNVLISTSIGEEGLDVGEVDLIICFDVSQHSPTRLVQRMGRTGRKRDGHIIILVTDGREHETLKSTMARRDSLNHKILNTSNIFSSLYQNNPRMIPDIFTPECIKMHINMQPKSPVRKYKNGRGKLDKKENKRKNIVKGTTAIIESNIESQKDEAKFSMMKYLRGERQRGEHGKNNFDLLSFDQLKNNNIRNTIKLSDVKILCNDNDAVDFLTMCTLRNSEKEGIAKNKRKIDKARVPEFPSIKNFFNFSIPDIKKLDYLSTLNDIISLNYDKNKLSNDCENDERNDSYVNENVFDGTMRKIVNKCIDEESKFEDLLDDSSKSNESDLLDDEEKKSESSNVRSTCAPLIVSIDSNRYLDSDVSKTVETRNIINRLQDLKSEKFEDILNETSDESEISHAENFEKTRAKGIGRRNDIEIKNFPNIVTLDDTVGTKAIKINDNFSAGNVKNYEETNKSSYAPKFSEFEDRSTLSITQAIDEIARLNSNSIISKAIINESEDDMFQDESFLLKIDESNFDPSEHKSEKSFEKSRNLNDKKNKINAEFKMEEYERDEDFEISVDRRQNCTKFDASEEKEKNSQTCFSNNEEWISVEKSVNVSKNTSRTSIAKKLANIRKSQNSRHDYTKECAKDKNDCTNDCELLVKIEEKSDYFFDESNDDFTEKLNGTRGSESRGRDTKYFRKHNRDRKSRKRKKEFIRDEAEVSLNDDTTDESSGTDEDLEDFISYTQNVHDTSDMHAHYLQTIRSPIKRQHVFLFKQPPTLASPIEIYSQPITDLDESYINDSFCVSENESEEEVARDKNLSVLEKAEQELKRRKRKRTRNEESSRNAQRNKRRNVINYFSNSSEDETEKLRKQIKDESLLLKQS